MNNNFQNPLKVLQTKYKEGWSGCIEIAEPKDSSVKWQVYLLQGKLQYISISNGKQARLNYLWQKFKLGSNCPLLKDSQEKVSEYVQLNQWLLDKQLSKEHLKKILFMFVTEGLAQVLSIESTKIRFKPAKRIKTTIISFELTKLVSNVQIKSKVKAWQEIRNYFYSPASRLYLEQKNALNFYKIWKELYTKPELEILANSQKLSSFISLFVAKSTLYEIATKSKVDTYFLIKYLQEPIQKNILSILPCSELSPKEKARQSTLQSEPENKTHSLPTDTVEENKSKTLVVCIDDSKTVQKQVKMTLEAAGYQVLSITDPTIALKNLAQHQPAVIFMDINMPNINGYDLCSLLRKSQKFKDIPIVMLTGRDGMIDRVRAKIVGANDYLTKPCDPHKLIALAQMLEKSAVTAG